MAPGNVIKRQGSTFDNSDPYDADPYDGNSWWWSSVSLTGIGDT